ncbi:MAG TPA: hypothetical protein VK007_09180 [Acidimicrobiales bacterium]|nr:hypothetical protein [Acidimicrobiales bacterium]
MAGSSRTAAGRAARRPVWKEVEEDEARRVANRVRAARRARPTRRYAVVYDTSGPKVRLGILWFLAALAAIAVSPLLVALLYGTTAAVAAGQTARAWRRRRARPNEHVAMAVAGAMGLGAVLGAGGSGLALLAGTILAYAAATGDTRSKHPAVADAGWTLQCAMPPGIAAMSMVLLARLDQGSAIALLLLVSAYETGDYLVGSGARNPYEGPAAGGSAIVVITFIVSTLPISALDFGQAWAFGGAVLVLAPLGQLFASALLPTAGAPASGLRRLDSLLLAGPLWAYGVGFII